MEFLDQRALALVPNRVRWVVLGLLLTATAASAGCAIWLVEARGSDALTVALLSVFRAAAIGTALWFFFMIGQRAQSRADLLRRTSEILTHEIPSSLKLYGKLDESELRNNRMRGSRIAPDGPDQVEVEVRHVPGTVHARYTIRWPGVEGALALSAHLNVKVISLVYFFPSGEFRKLEAAFADIIAAANHSDWTMRVEGVRSQRFVGNDQVFAEMTGRRKLSPDFLHEPTERLFVTNDLAAMTRGIMIAWHRRQEALDS